MAPIRCLATSSCSSDRQSPLTEGNDPVSLAYQLAAAAGILMQKEAGTPAVWIEGTRPEGSGTLRDLLRDPARDLFR